MNWQNSDDLFEKEDKFSTGFIDQNSFTTSLNELKQKTAIQLKKFQDPDRNVERQAYIELTTQFSNLLVRNNFEEMTRRIITNDCEFFIFSSTERPPVRYTTSPKGLHGLYKDIHIQDQVIRETYVDLEKNTVVQISNIQVLYEGEQSPSDEIVIELFTIRDNRICKYRASFGCMRPTHGDTDPFELTRKDKILAVVKQMNYALADKPDLHKVASFFHEKTQIKVWSWETQKCFTFYKYDFAKNFHNLEGNLRIKCIVPYQIFTDTEFAVGTYVYHLDGVSGQYEGRNYIWANTCVFAFDDDINIVKISQQGELHLEGEIDIPYEVFTRERLVQRVQVVCRSAKPSPDLMYQDIVQTNCQVCKFGAENLPDVGTYHALDSSRKMQENLEKGTIAMDLTKVVDLYVDHHDPSYDTVIAIVCNQGMLSFPGYKYSDKMLNSIHILRSSFENGKLAKVMVFSSEILDPMPSFFDDPTFEAKSIIKKCDVV